MNDIMEAAENAAYRLRGTLHGLPEASMHEEKTKAALTEFLKNGTALELSDCGDWFYASYRLPKDHPRSGVPALALRADFDAVRGEDGVCRHLCGHDGHASALAAFGKWVSDAKPDRNICLLFQPGEESGEGALVCRELFRRENIGEIYGFHNIPGYPVGKILLRDGTFACASEGLEIRMTGRPAHAAYPEAGINPAEALSRLVLQSAGRLREPHRGMVLSTVIGIDAGSDRYGVSASDGCVRFTVRAEREDEFRALAAAIRADAERLAGEYGLVCTVKESDVFPATENTPACSARLRACAEKAGLPYEFLPSPFRWSEDFGQYLISGASVPGAMFGVGSGEDCPQLHTADYRFPDAVIPSVLRMYRALCENG